MSRMIAILFAALWLVACNSDGSGGSSSSSIRQQAREAIQAGTPATATQEAATQQYAQNIQFTLPKGMIAAGATQCFDVKVAAFKDILAMQYTLHWDKNVLAFTEVKGFKLPFMSNESFGITLAPEGKLTSVWIENSLKGASVPDGESIYQICFKAVGKPGQASDISVSGNPTAIEVVTVGDQIWGIQAPKGTITIQ